ncbi:hypothetical protein PHYBOEH_008296 [Phytophthora boehmeriae]|uniref:Uncharacterized protein n=1 Tax=Phytophthora boehmeriae TaxID=109152 RepID=A0A8T1X6J1_9STRA|nr:hypothetical protein PHYBOEH_008296 [Phytophthora boehmeriae]
MLPSSATRVTGKPASRLHAREEGEKSHAVLSSSAKQATRKPASKLRAVEEDENGDSALEEIITPCLQKTVVEGGDEGVVSQVWVLENVPLGVMFLTRLTTKTNVCRTNLYVN